MSRFTFPNLKQLKYGKPNERNIIEVMGFEPYFGTYVSVASIYLPHPKNAHLLVDGEAYHISHSHGYFPKHPYGNRVKSFCKRNLV